MTLTEKERKLAEVDTKIAVEAKNSMRKKMRSRYRTLSDQYKALQDDFHMLSERTRNEIEAAKRASQIIAENESQGYQSRTKCLALSAAQLFEKTDGKEVLNQQLTNRFQTGAAATVPVLPITFQSNPRALRSLSEEGTVLQYRSLNESSNGDQDSPTSRYRFLGAGESTNPYDVPSRRENHFQQASAERFTRQHDHALLLGLHRSRLLDPAHG